MAYSLEIRDMVIKFVNSGGSKAKASEIYGVSVRTIFYWQNRKELAPQLNHTKGYKIDKEEFKKILKTRPDIYERELSELFKVSQPAVSKMLKKLGFSNKKKSLDTMKQIRKK